MNTPSTFSSSDSSDMEKKGIYKYFKSNSTSTQDTHPTSDSESEFVQSEISNAQSGNESNTPSTSETSVARVISDVIESESEGSEVESENDSEMQQKSKRKKQNVVRKYNAEYLAFRFISLEIGPHCLVCKKSFANSSIMPVKMLRHLGKTHPHLVEKPIDYFKDLQSQLKNQGKSMEGHANSQLKAIESSFTVADQIAKAKKAVYTSGTSDPAMPHASCKHYGRSIISGKTEFNSIVTADDQPPNFGNGM